MKAETPSWLILLFWFIFRPTELTESDYEALAEETLDSMCAFFEDLPEIESCHEDYDCAFGVCSVVCSQLKKYFYAYKQ